MEKGSDLNNSAALTLGIKCVSRLPSQGLRGRRVWSVITLNLSYDYPGETGDESQIVFSGVVFFEVENNYPWLGFLHRQVDKHSIDMDRVNLFLF